jgi:hypothetical protein
MAAADAGTWTYVVKVRTPGGTAESKPISFSTAGSKGQRFLRAPKAQGPYLETADGAPCFLIGHNYCWPPGKERTYGVEGAFARMAAAGMNATRLWLCSWGLHIEGEEPDDYRLDDAWRLDLVFQAARERGIYVQLCLDNFADFTTKKGAERNPYLAANGGPCQTAPQFFSNAKAREQYQRRLRYLAARYAPFTSLLAWELFNEVSHAGEGPRDPAVVEWAANSAAQLKKLDPYGHPVTISVGLRSDWDALWRLPEIDLVEAHTYIPRPTNGAPPQETDSPALILAERDALDGHGKPVLVAEFGFMGTKEFNPLNEADKTGVHLHSALWASALGGCAGTALHWWWDSYLAEHDLYYHYAALASFLRGTELPGPRWAPVRSKAGSQLRVVGYRGREAALLWIQNAANTWHRRLIEGRDPVAIGRATVEVPRLADGRYRVEWWDTYTGEPLTHTTEETAGGTLLLRVPERVPDVACKVSRLER